MAYLPFFIRALVLPWKKQQWTNQVFVIFIGLEGIIPDCQGFRYASIARRHGKRLMQSGENVTDMDEICCSRFRRYTDN